MQNRPSISSAAALRNIDLTPVAYLKKLLELKKGGTIAFTKDQLDKQFKDWLDRHRNDPGLMEKLKYIGPPMKFAIEYLKEKNKGKRATLQDKQELSEKYKQAAELLAKSKPQRRSDGRNDNALDEKPDHPAADLYVDYADDAPDLAELQEELLIAAEHSEPGEAVPLVLLATTLAPSALVATIAGALLLLKKMLGGTAQEQSVCLSGVMGVLGRERMRFVRDPLEKQMANAASEDIFYQMAGMRGMADDQPPETRGPSENYARSHVKNSFSENAASATQNTRKAASTNVAAQTANRARTPFDVPNAPSFNWHAPKTKKDSDA